MTLFSAILFSVFTSAMFFIKGQFFAGSGTSDLLNYFSNVPYICILVVPSLCYKKSINIYDDFIPVSRGKKLLQNFLRIFINFAIIIAFMIPVCLLVNLFGSVDAGQVFTSILCLLFYGASLIALCLLINEVFVNSIVSFVVSALLLAVFNSIHLVPLYVNTNAFFTLICKLFSFAWHFDAASKGIIDTRDILLLLLCTIIFLYSAWHVIMHKKGKCFTRKQKTFYAEIFALLLLVLFNSAGYYKRFDFSKTKSYSVSSYTKKLADNLEDNLKITYYRSGTLSKLYPQIRDVSDFLTSYTLLNRKISYTIKDPDKDAEIQTMLDNYGVTSQQIQNVGATTTQYTSVYSAIVLEYRGMIQIIPFLMSSQTLEYDMAMRIKNLLQAKNMIVNIVVGNGMSLDEDYNFIIPWLNSQGILANPLYIEDPAFTTNLSLASGPLLVIGDSNINIENAIAIENYILEQKGNAVFAVSPYSCSIEEDWSLTSNSRTNIVEMLENWGVTFTDKITADISCARITMYSDDGQEQNPFEASSTVTEVLNYPLWISLLPQEFCRLGMTLFWPVSLELSQNATPYLVTSPMAYTYKTDRSSPKRLIETNPFYVQPDTAANKEKGTQIIGAQITGPLSGLYNLAACDDSNIIVIPDQYFLNTLMTGYIGGDFGDYRNFEFISNCLLNLAGESELAQLQSKTTRDTSLYKVTDELQFLKLRLLVFIMIFVVIPMVEGGIFLLKSRHCRARHGNLLRDYRVKPDNDKYCHDRIISILLLSLITILTITELLYLTVFSKTGEKKRHQQEIQLLHEADISQIDGIIIQGNNEGLILKRTDDMWLLTDMSNPGSDIPADTQRLAKLFVNLVSKHTMTKTGKKDSTIINTYGLDETNGTVISLFKNGTEYQRLYFGSTDFSQSRRYFTTLELNSVFLFDSSFENFLSTSVQSWSDPYIISQQLKDEVFQMGEPQDVDPKIFELRHGGIAESLIDLPLDLSFTIQMGDKSTITLDIYEYPTDDSVQEYVVSTTFDSPRLGKSFSYKTKISLWTYNKIKEIML
ncbi:MAG: Gldg family protein [Treponema sp.]|nr:Gldg family protein [Treponema sp.]